MPQEKEWRDQQAYYKSATSDQHGAFGISGVSPGEYQLYAWECSGSVGNGECDPH